MCWDTWLWNRQSRCAGVYFSYTRNVFTSRSSRRKNNSRQKTNIFNLFEDCMHASLLHPKTLMQSTARIVRGRHEANPLHQVPRRAFGGRINTHGNSLRTITRCTGYEQCRRMQEGSVSVFISVFARATTNDTPRTKWDKRDAIAFYYNCFHS